MATSTRKYSRREVSPAMDVYKLDTLIERFTQYQVAAGRASGTRDRYKFTFLHFQRFLQEHHYAADFTILTTRIIEEFAIWLRETPISPQHGTDRRAESGIHAHLRDIRAFTRWLYRNELIEKEVIVNMPRLPKRLIRTMTKEELNKVWACSLVEGGSSMAKRNRAMLALMFDTGLRREEVANLTLADVSLDNRFCTVIGKGNKQRRVPFSHEVRGHLLTFLKIRGIEPGSMFELSAQGIRTIFRRIKDETGLEYFHPHLARHQYATTMVRKGTDGEHLMMLMGHEDFNTTRKYLHLDDDDLMAAHEAASPFASLFEEELPALPHKIKYSSRN